MLSNEGKESALLFKEILLSTPGYNKLAHDDLLAKYSAIEIERSIGSNFSPMVAVFENQIVGLCFSEVDSYTIWVDWIGVNPKFRKIGVASLLLQELEMMAKQSNHFSIWCDTLQENLRAINFFKQHGYANIGKVNSHWYGLNFLFWSKLLK